MGRRKTKLLGVNMRPENHARLHRVAEIEGKWLSEWVREVLYSAADEVEARQETDGERAAA